MLVVDASLTRSPFNPENDPPDAVVGCCRDGGGGGRLRRWKDLVELLLAGEPLAAARPLAHRQRRRDRTRGTRIWSILKWPVLLVVVGLMFALLYWASPNVKQPGFRWISPGGLFAVVLWVVASGVFALYVANFASYNKTYGALGGVIVFLVWLWLTNVAILLGAELDAELERGRQIEAGHPADVEPFLEPRDTRKMKHPPASTDGGSDTRTNGEGDAGNGHGRDGGSDEQEGLEAWRERLRRLREWEEAGRG